MPRKFNGERKMFSTYGTEINESSLKKKKRLKMYHRPDDNGLVLDLSTDYRVGYLFWKYFKPYTTHPCVHYPSMNIHVYTQIDWLYILLEDLTYVLLLWTISNPHSSFTRLEKSSLPLISVAFIGVIGIWIAIAKNTTDWWFVTTEMYCSWFWKLEV